MQKQNILRYATLKPSNPPQPYKNQPLFENSIIYSKTKDDFSKLHDSNPPFNTKSVRLLTDGSQPYHKNQPFISLNTNKDKPKRQTVETKLKEERKNFEPSCHILQKGISQKQFKFVGNCVNLKKSDYVRKEKPIDCFPVWIKKDIPSKVFNNFLGPGGNKEKNGKTTQQQNSLNLGSQYWNLKSQKTNEAKPNTGYIRRSAKTQNDEHFDASQTQDNQSGFFYRKSYNNAIRKTQTDEQPVRNQDRNFNNFLSTNADKYDKNNRNSEKMSFEKVFMMKENKLQAQNKENRKTTCAREKTAPGLQRQRYTTNLNDERLNKSPQIVKPFSNNQNVIQEQQKISETNKVSLNNDKYMAENEPKKIRVNTEENENESKSYLYKQRVLKTAQNEVLETSQLMKKPIDWKKELMLTQKIGEGTFGKVYKAKLRQNCQKQVYAVKKVYIDKKYKSRELQIVQELNHGQVMKVHNVFVTAKDANEQYLNIVMDYYDKNLFEVVNEMKGGRQTSMARNSQLQQKVFIYQILKGLSYIHSLRICHRDIKPHNMLVKGWELVLCDFGSAKKLIPGQGNLSYICSRCYRAPQLIFGSTQYTTQIDMWSAACVIIEMLHGLPLFIGENSLDHLLEVIKVVGTPSKQEVLQMNPNYDISEYDLPVIKRKSFSRLFPKADSKLIDLVNKLMNYNPHERLSAIEALSHNYFDDLRKEDTFNILEGQLPKDKLQKLYEFSEKQIEMYNLMSEARRKGSKLCLKQPVPILTKKPSQIRDLLTPMWWQKRQV